MRRAALILILALGSAILPEAALLSTPASAEAVTAFAPFVLAPPTLLSAREYRAQRVHFSCGAGRACLSLSLSPAWNALSPTRVTLAQQGAATRANPATALRSPRSMAFSVGKRVTLKSGRELSLQLTPTPARCAPLFSVTY